MADDAGDGDRRADRLAAVDPGARRLRLAHGGRAPLPVWAAALLSHIITRAATKGLEGDVVPEPYRSAGIQLLLDRGLITVTEHGYRPSDEVLFSLRLESWHY